MGTRTNVTGDPSGRSSRFPGAIPSILLLFVVGALIGSAPGEAGAQYFGQNQVRWDRFDFQVLDTEHFRIHYYPEADDAIRDAARLAERWYERLARSFTYELPERNPLILYANHPDFQQTNVIQGRVGEGTGGVTEGLRQRVVMPLTESNADTDHVLGHELVHVFQFSIASRGAGLGGLLRQPLWVVEGLAEYLSIGRADPLTAMWLRDAILRDEFPSVQDLGQDPQRYFPYRFGHAFWAYVAGAWDDETAMRTFRLSLDRGMGGAIPEALGTSRDSLGAQWQRDVRATYEPLMEGRDAPEAVGRTVLTPEGTGGGLNLAPSVSPDGELVAFYSERGVFSIELWLAEVETGRVLRRLASTETDPHFDALAFVQSAGSWSPDGSRFAFVVFARGENRLVTVDAAGGDRREYAIEGVGAMNHPDWSPDGRRIVLTGQSGGRSDLWMVDVETGESERLTNDAYTAIQPAWSPDGGTIAFVTERGAQTNLDQLDFGPLRLAMLDVGSGEIDLVAPFPTGKAIDPAFSPDGSSLYFVADPDGFSDIYRMDVGSGEVFRVTRVVTGVSGLSERSSVLSVASEEGRLLFSVFAGGDYRIHTLSEAEAVGERVSPAQVAQDPPGALPPADRVGEGFVMASLRDATIGLPPRPTQPAEPYRGGLGLEFIGPVQIGVGADQFGAVAGGSVSFQFGDMLGHRMLQLAVQAQGEIQDIGGQALYLNQRGRWTWGGVVGRTPYRTGFTQVGPGEEAGTQIVSQVQQRVAQHQALGLASYPFSRVLRAEFMAGASFYTYSAERWNWTLLGGRTIDVERVAAPEFEFPSVTLYQGSAALVGDNSVMGFVSPARGHRWRLEVQPTFGAIEYTTGLADFRRYFSGRPVTLATRGMHLGRYGADAEDERISPLFLGYESLVRGYSIGSFRPSECSGSASDCPEFQRLVGSRVAVANVELRVPVIGVEGYGLIEGGFFPLEMGVFADAGVAWTSEESPELAWERRSVDRIPVTSAGATARVGLGQYLALEVFWAYPFQRPDRGGHFGFQLAPGW